MYSLKYQMILVITWPSTSSNASHWIEKEYWETYCLWKTALLFWNSGKYFAHYFCFIELRVCFSTLFINDSVSDCPKSLLELLCVMWTQSFRLPQHCFWELWFIFGNRVDEKFFAFHNIVFEELSKDTESPLEFLGAKHLGKSERLKEEKGNGPVRALRN